MKSQIKKQTEADLLKSYPIKGQATGWFYRTTETSNNAWIIEGSDYWGRIISIQGDDPETLIKKAELEAKKLMVKLKHITNRLSTPAKGAGWTREKASRSH